MSKIQIAELNSTNSELNLLDNREAAVVVGGYDRKALRNKIVNDININTIIQINNNINIQLAFNGDNFNIANLNNTAGVS